MSERVGGGVYEGVDAGLGGLVEGAADFEVEGRDGGVCAGDVAIEVCFGDVFGEDFSLF